MLNTTPVICSRTTSSRPHSDFLRQSAPSWRTRFTHPCHCRQRCHPSNIPRTPFARRARAGSMLDWPFRQCTCTNQRAGWSARLARMRKCPFSSTHTRGVIGVVARTCMARTRTGPTDMHVTWRVCLLLRVECKWLPGSRVSARCCILNVAQLLDTHKCINHRESCLALSVISLISRFLNKKI